MQLPNPPPLKSTTVMVPFHPIPPFTADTAHAKVKAAQDKWNTRDPVVVAKAYTPNCVWRNRDEFFQGTDAIVGFLQRKWAKEHNYRLRKELFAFDNDRIAVEFWYEYSETEDPASQWYRTYGIEHWVFVNDGRMKSRQMSGNTIPIGPHDRWFKDGADINAGDIPAGHISSSQTDATPVHATTGGPGGSMQLRRGSTHARNDFR